jgi:hypothetical protein
LEVGCAVCATSLHDRHRLLGTWYLFAHWKQKGGWLPAPRTVYGWESSIEV